MQINAHEEREGHEWYFDSGIAKRTTLDERIVTPGRNSNQMTVTVTPHSRLPELTSSLANIPSNLNCQHNQLLTAKFNSADTGNVEKRKEPRYFKTKICKYFPSLQDCPRGSR